MFEANKMAVPFHEFLSRVRPGSGVPANSVYVTLVFTCLIALIIVSHLEESCPDGSSQHALRSAPRPRSTSSCPSPRPVSSPATSPSSAPSSPSVSAVNPSHLHASTSESSAPWPTCLRFASSWWHTSSSSSPPCRIPTLQI